MRRLVLCAYLVTLLAALGVAQPHPGGIMVGGGYPDTNLNYLNGIYLAGKDGSFATIVDTYFTSRPFWADVTPSRSRRTGPRDDSIAWGCCSTCAVLRSTRVSRRKRSLPTARSCCVTG